MNDKNSVTVQGILVEKEFKELGNAKGTCIIECKVNIADKGAKENTFIVKVIRNGKEKAEKIFKKLPKTGTLVRGWGSLSTYLKDGASSTFVSCVGGISDPKDSLRYASYSVVGKVNGFDEESSTMWVESDSSYEVGGVRQERTDDIHLTWAGDEFDHSLVGKRISARGKAKDFKSVNTYDEASQSFQPKAKSGAFVLPTAIEVLEDAPAADGATEPSY